MRMALNVYFLVLISLLFSPASLHACASCGSGGASPLVLYPNENIKAYLGLSLVGGFEEIKADGERGEMSGAEQKETYTFAAGYRVLPSLTIGAAIPYANNRIPGDRSESAAGDPLIDSRWTLVSAAWDRPAIPQVQLVSSFKKSVARSLNEQRDPDSLDVFGNGSDEFTTGVDIWWGMAKVKTGVAFSGTHAFQRNIAGSSLQRGKLYQTVASVGFYPMRRFFVSGGGRAAMKERDLAAGRRISDSESRQYDAFLSSRWNPQPVDEIRLTLVRSAIAFNNKNATRSDGLTAGYARNF